MNHSVHWLESKELPLAETDLRESLVLAACRMDHGLGFFVITDSSNGASGAVETSRGEELLLSLPS